MRFDTRKCVNAFLDSGDYCHLGDGPWDERMKRDANLIVAAVLEGCAGCRDAGLVDLLSTGFARGGNVCDLVDGFVLHGSTIPFLLRTLHRVQ